MIKRRYLITGITGTMGKELTRTILKNDPSALVVGISRDEQKQQLFPIKNTSRVKLKLANVVDRRSLFRAALNSSWEGYTAIFHLAALKCAPFLEDNPEEAFEVNVIGTQNVLELANETGSHVCFTSTDKSVKPINTYGYTKGLAERLVLAASDRAIGGHTVFRYGNILGSRGSFLHSLVRSLKEDGEVQLTHQDMTRFWMATGDVAKFIYHSRDQEGLQIPLMKSAKVTDLCKEAAGLLGITAFRFVDIGIRPGEKIHEDITESKNSGQKEQLMSRDELRSLLARCFRGMGILDRRGQEIPVAAENN